MFMNDFATLEPRTSARLRFGAGFLFACILTLGLLPFPDLSAQVIESWEVYSALDRSTSVASAPDGSVWVATTGGVYRYDPATETAEPYRTDGSILDLTATAIGVDPENGDVYVGGKDGTISILRHEGWWTYVTDIARSSRPDPAIRGFRFGDGRAYILTTFGVAVYNPSDSTIRDSWTRLGTITPNTGVNDLAFFRDSVWVATDSGLAAAPATGRDLADPLNWRTFDQSACGRQALSLIVIDGVLNVGTSDGACMLDDGSFARRDDLGGPVRFSRNGDRVVAAGDFRLYRLGGSGRFEEAVQSARRIVGVAALPDGSPVGALERDGIGLVDGSGLELFAPNGPVSNTFEDLVFGLDGSLWVGTSGDGIARLIEEDWTNYTKENTPGQPTNSSWRINVDDLGRIWVGTFGDGLVILNPQEGTEVGVTHYDETNSPLNGIPGNDAFIITADAAADGFGRVWLLNWYNGNDDNPVLISLRRNESGSSEEFEQHRATVTRLRQYSRLTIDFNGTKWMACDASNGGLLFFNENAESQGGTRWGLLTTTHGLPSGQQTALLVDPDGELWIGTPLGLTVLVNPGSVMQNGAGSAIFRTIRPLENVFIRDIAVDALNRKWIGTDNGVVVLSSDGTELLATYTESNSPLVNNQIRAILPNDLTGEIYIGTVEGMNKVKTEAVRSEIVDRLSATPQPYELSSSEPMRITGLPSNSTVKILSLSGTLIREFRAPGGGVAFWNGRDASGEPVASGVYLIAARSSLGETVIGKAAVVRR